MATCRVGKMLLGSLWIRFPIALNPSCFFKRGSCCCCSSQNKSRPPNSKRIIIIRHLTQPEKTVKSWENRWKLRRQCVSCVQWQPQQHLVPVSFTLYCCSCSFASRCGGRQRELIGNAHLCNTPWGKKKKFEDKYSVFLACTVVLNSQN